MIISYDGSLSGYDAGGQAVVTFTVYKEAVNADAIAAVLYDVDGDGTKEVVSSVEAAYDGTDLAGRIETVVETANGYRLMPVRDYTVRYYSADGTQVRTLIDAGTYTLKVTSDIYKLTGTTEMTVTINKIGATNVKAAAVTDKKWDNVGNVTSYLPWQADGVTLDELNLQYKDGDSWVPFPMDVIKATILDSEGNEVKKIEEEGVYTIHFEGRNPNADNYVVPGDITITCIKDGTEAEEDGSHVNHLIFTDVNYIDYFADPVNYVANKKFMNGYANTNVFGSYDNLTSGQVACVPYNMALDNRKDDETDLVYTEDKGYITGFSDVDGKAYYGAAIAWAKQAGVVNDYGDGTFKPEQTVTREEFCAMLANYASKYEDGYAEGDAATLADFEDADQVSEWAEKVVAWGVENGIIGNGGFLAPSASIIRADAACMVYNYAEAE